MASMVLPAPPSWYPGHMRQFVCLLPALLSRTDVVLELRDARLPLTSINSTFEGLLQKWRYERQKLAEAFAVPGQRSFASGVGPSLRGHSSLVCERIVVMNKRDLVPEWGIEPYRKAMASRLSDQRVIFASRNEPKDVKSLLETVVIVGMPNVGKSTLLNALRNKGIPGPTPKALRTSAHPGLTRALSTRLKLSQDPLVYSFDSPGVMLPFLGKGALGAERGIKLALIAGIREGLYSEGNRRIVIYLLHILTPGPHLVLAPAYLSILPPGTPPVDDIYLFLDLLAQRLSMLKRGGERDTARAAVWFVRWWREEGCALSATAPILAAADSKEVNFGSISASGADVSTPDVLRINAQTGGWGFDFQWELKSTDVDVAREDAEQIVQREMERAIDLHLKLAEEEENDGGDVSNTQQKKREKEVQRAKREKRLREALATRRSGKK
ncbi:hypothetical protein EW145_g5365 [Phellinidium pouzarii]|uniref:G domain-containing protein n=1 Tax=Phellinidium pouzarii TaxID=167371 RepID=A0A4S4L234_9AGAM|nr:hypothetical protein EW145_g5365 [Phellinidium pouzarii]